MWSTDRPVQQQQILSGYEDGDSSALSFSLRPLLFVSSSCSFSFSRLLSYGLFLPFCRSPLVASASLSLSFTFLRLVHWKAWRPNEDVSTRPALVHGRAFVLRPSLLHSGDKEAASLAVYRSFQMCQMGSCFSDSFFIEFDPRKI